MSWDSEGWKEAAREYAQNRQTEKAKTKWRREARSATASGKQGCRARRALAL
jgi:hypothetical protein